MKVHFSVLILTLFIFDDAVSLQCKNEENEAVDWFVAYKLPKESKLTTNDHIKNGLAYVFLTSSDYTSWKLSSKSIGDQDSMIANTLSDLYGTEKVSTTYVLYNDQPPSGSSVESKGHTKGVVLANANEGTWLVHSVPHFPSNGSTYEYPSTGQTYGQSFLCISTTLGTIDTVGIQLQYNNPEIYSYSIKSNVESSLPNLVEATKGTSTQSGTTSEKTIKSKNGVSFNSFAKSSNFGKDLYADLVASTLKVDLDVESWPNEANRLPSDCSKTYKVYNIVSVNIEVVNVNFKTTTDHSKWAVSSDGNWICVGDINRAAKQESRGGGTVCLNNKKLAANYKNAINSTESCSNGIF